MDGSVGQRRKRAAVPEPGLRVWVNARREAEAPIEALTCAICLDVFAAPCSLSCGHSFCNGCLAGVNKSAGCPTCRAPWPADFAPHPNFVVRDLVGGLLVCCRFGVREGAAGEWEPAPVAEDVCPLVLRLDDVGAHEASCDFARTPCVYAGCGALLRASEVAAHNAHAAATHAASERAAHLAERARADDLQRRLDKLEPYAVTVIEQMMELDAFGIESVSGDVNAIVELMTLHAPGAAVTSTGCDALLQMTEFAAEYGGSTSIVADALVRSGGVDALVAALRTHGASKPRIAEQTCEALANVVENGAAARKAEQSGVVAALLAALLAHEHHASMQQAGLRLLTNLIDPAAEDESTLMEAQPANDTAVLRALKDGGALTRIFAAVRAHLAYESTLYWAVLALRTMQPLDAAAAETAVASLATVLGAPSTGGNTALLRNGFALLRSIITAANTSADAAAALSGAVVAALRAAPADTALQQTGVATLAALCAAGHAAVLLAAAVDGVAPDAAPATAAAVIAAAMVAHPAVQDVQSCGMRVLASIAALSSDGALAAGDPGCLACILAAMKARAMDPETQRLGAATLACIFSTSLVLRGVLIAAATAVAVEAVSVLTAALVAFGAGDVVVAVTALRTFACVDAGLLPAALPAVLAAMASHVARAELQRDGCKILQRIGATSDTTCSTALTAGQAAAAERVRALVTSLRVHGQADAALAVNALAALKALVNSTLVSAADAAAAATAVALEAGGMEAVMRALEAHAAVLDVQRYGCWALSHMCAGSHAACSRAKDAGGAAVVAAALAAHPDSAVVIHAKAVQRLLSR